MRKFLYTAFASILGLIILIVLFISYINYSEGSRAGFVVKMSTRGYIFKTHEGQLNVGGMTSDGSGVIPTIWDFSVKRSDKDVLKTLEDAQLTGERVKVYYKEKLYKFFWIADTKYYVYKVEKASDKNISKQNVKED
jgi:hypothetical protein